MADSTVAALTAISTLDENELFYCVDDPAGTPADRKITLAQIRAVMHPGYVANRYYVPPGVASATSPTAGGIDSIRLFPFFVFRKVTVSELAVRVGTNQAAQNVQAAIYASDASTMRPTGNALGSTGNISAASTGNVSGALGANVQLTPGLMYWMATNASHAGIVLSSIASIDGTIMAVTNGTATLGNLLASSGQHLTGLSVAQTFGTWPDLTSGSFTEVAASSIGIVAFRVASMP